MNDRQTELKEHSAHIFEMGCMEQRVYLKNDADAVIESKDAEIAEIKQRYNDIDIAHTVHIAKMNAKIEELESKNAQLEDDVAFWKKKLSSCLNGDCILTCDTVEKYGKENVRLKRALYKACANWAKYKKWDALTPNKDWEKWHEVSKKCRAMAEKFGG